MIRCKFTCNSVRKFRSIYNSEAEKFLYEANFCAVTSGSKENESFFKFTPSASLVLAAYKENAFEPGKDYYVDLTEVPIDEDRLQKFWKPDGINIDLAHEEQLTLWMKKHGIYKEPGDITIFMHSKEMVALRNQAAKEL